MVGCLCLGMLIDGDLFTIIDQWRVAYVREDLQKEIHLQSLKNGGLLKFGRTYK